MSKDKRVAAAPTGGQPDAVPERTENALAKSDEKLRRLAAARLAEQLDIGSGLVERCEQLAAIPDTDRVRAILAAARMMQANAAAARALARVAGVEARSRRIVEYVQPPVPISNDSNSNLENSLQHGLMQKMLRYLQLYADGLLDPAIEEMTRDGLAEKGSAPDPAAGAGPA